MCGGSFVGGRESEAQFMELPEGSVDRRMFRAIAEIASIW